MGVISTNGDRKVDLQQFLTIFEESTLTAKVYIHKYNIILLIYKYRI